MIRSGHAIRAVSRPVLLPAVAVIAGLLALEVAYGVDPGDALLYLGYELMFDVIPGWLAYRALSQSPGSAVRQIAIGWALGYVLEILAFMLTAATGTRDLLFVYPLVVGLPALAISARQSFPDLVTSEVLSRRSTWLLTAVCLAAISYFAVGLFPTTPLPGTNSVAYYPDHAWMISIAADAKHHWPIQDPNVSGEPLPYHYFVNIHLAAASQVTGLGLPLVYFRLFTLPLAVLLTLQLAMAGRSFAGSSYVGLIAACLVLFVGQLQMDTRQTGLVHAPFLGFFFGLMLVSPSFLFGLVIFIPLITLLGEQFATQHTRAEPRAWLLIVLFMVGASDAKILILPLVLCALVLFSGWRWLAERRVPRTPWLAAAAAAVVAGVVYFLQYRGHSSGTRFDLHAGIDFVNRMPAVLLIKHDLAGALPSFFGKAAVLSAGGVVFGLVGLLAAQFVGLIWIIRRHGYRWDRSQAWLGSLALTGLIGLAALRDPSSGTLYILEYGVVAGCLLSAAGLFLGWKARPPVVDIRGRRLAAVSLTWVLALAVLLAIPVRFHLFAGSGGEADTYAFWYGGLLLTLALLYAAARRWMGPTRWVAGALVCGAVLAVGALDTPTTYLTRGLTNSSAPITEGRGLTPALYRALTWVRDNTPDASVIAVNNRSPIAFDYSAFAERRVFLGGWGYSQRSREVGYAKVAAGVVNPFANRLKLNDAAFIVGSRAALQRMVQRYGVRYLVIDQVNGAIANVPALLSVARTVYRAPGVVVLAIGGKSLR